MSGGCLGFVNHQQFCGFGVTPSDTEPCKAPNLWLVILGGISRSKLLATRHQDWLCVASYAAAACWRCPCAGTSVSAFFEKRPSLVHRCGTGVGPHPIIKTNLANSGLKDMVWFVSLHSNWMFGFCSRQIWVSKIVWKTWCCCFYLNLHVFFDKILPGAFCSIGIHGFMDVYSWQRFGGSQPW